MTTCPASNASARRASDHDPHTGSSVKRSSRTFESTRTPDTACSLVPASERHDLLGAHGRGRATTHCRSQGRPLTGAQPDDASSELVDAELDLAARSDAKPLANVLRDRH